MNDKPTKVTLNLPKTLNLDDKDIEVLRKHFRADIIETLKKKGEDDVPVLDDTTRVTAPSKDY